MEITLWEAIENDYIEIKNHPDGFVFDHTQSLFLLSVDEVAEQYGKDNYLHELTLDIQDEVTKILNDKCDIFFEQIKNRLYNKLSDDLKIEI